MRKSVQKALMNQRKRDQQYNDSRHASPSNYNTRLLRSDAKGTRRMRKKIIEDDYGSLPIR